MAEREPNQSYDGDSPQRGHRILGTVPDFLAPLLRGGISEGIKIAEGLVELSGILWRDQLHIPGELRSADHIGEIATILANRFDPLDNRVKIDIHNDRASGEWKRAAGAGTADVSGFGTEMVGVLEAGPIGLIVESLVAGYAIDEAVLFLRNHDKASDEQLRIGKEWLGHLDKQVGEAAKQAKFKDNPKKVAELKDQALRQILKRHQAFERLQNQVVTMRDGTEMNAVDYARKIGLELDRAARKHPKPRKQIRVLKNSCVKYYSRGEQYLLQVAINEAERKRKQQERQQRRGSRRGMWKLLP